MFALFTASLLIAFGILACLLPILPGNIIIWLGILLHKLWMQEASVSWLVVLITGGLAVLAQVLDFVAGYWGAKRFGASRRGAVGALLGGIIGPLFATPLFGWFAGPLAPLFGLVVGPIIGALVGELSSGRTSREASRAGAGTVVGGILAFAIKFALGLLMAGLFYMALLLGGENEAEPIPNAPAQELAGSS